jgi:iron complex outermembrane receptor protein
VYAQAAAAPAAAASAPETQQVVVTGIRKGIEDAISVKKNQDSIVEAISAEDIGKLPDTTIAESLARLPGVTTQRDIHGNATAINIRGLGPDFNGYLLNGREQTSTGDSRAADLSVYPAELIAGATVYKTSDASLMTAGLAGTIDNKLIEPLAFGGRKFFASYQTEQRNRGLPVVGHGKRYSLSYIDQFADRKLGIALGWVHSDTKTNEIGVGGWGTQTNATATLADGSGVVTGVTVPNFGNGVDFQNNHVTDARTGVAAILQFKPSKEFNSEIDIFHSTIDATNKMARFQGGLGSTITDATVVGYDPQTMTGGTATGGTWALAGNPGGLIDRTESIFDKDTIQSIGWRSTWNFKEGYKALFDVNHNTAKRVERDIEAYAGIPGADTLSFTMPVGGVIPHFVVGNPSAYTDPNVIVIRDQTGWSGINGVPQAGYSKGPTVKDGIDAARLEINKDIGGSIFSDFSVGVNVSQRTKDRITDEGLIVSSTNGGHDPIPFPSNSYVEHNIGGTGLDMLTFDPSENLWPGATILRKYNDDILSKTWSVYENVTTAYTKWNVDTEWGKMPVRGNVGLQIVHTDQASSGYRADIGSGVVLTNPAGTQTRNGTSYNDVLPSVNLQGDLGSGNILRFGAGIQIARPNLTDERNSLAVSPNFAIVDGAGNPAPVLQASYGNPYLKPYKAKALDLSYEKYFGTKGYFSGALFYKQLDTYITPQTSVVNMQAAAQAVGINVPVCGTANGNPVCITSYDGIATTTVNGHGGNVKGFELAASLPFSLLTSWLDGFGLTGSYSNTTSSIKLPPILGLNPNQQIPTSGATVSLPGLSHVNDKLMVYFERWGFSAFIAQNYRSDYVGSVANSTVGGYPTLLDIHKQKWISAQVGYEIQAGWLKGLAVRLEGNNLNKPIYETTDATGNVATNKTGASADLRISYNY